MPIGRQLFLERLYLYGERPDKEYSLVDCTSFAVMRQRRIRAALTPDRHFAQGGVLVLMRP